MSKLLARVVSPTGLLYIFVTVTLVAHGVYFASKRESPPSFQLIYPLAFLWIIGWWLLSDSRKRGIKWVYDMGLFLYIAWRFILIYYLLKTRGAKGILVITGFLGTCVLAELVGIAVALLLFPDAAWPE